MKKEAMKFTDQAVELFKEVYDISGGAVVVDELPETGEPNTIYELHQEVYDWVAMVTHQMRGDGCVWENNAGIALFDTYDQMIDTLNGMDIGDNQSGGYCYLRTEDRLYGFYVDNSSWTFTEQEKITNYKFNMLDTNGDMNILKSYEGYDETDGKYYGTLLDNTRVVLGFDEEAYFNHFAFIPRQATYDMMSSFMSSGQINIHKVTTLPTAQEAVNNYLDDLVTNAGCINVEIDGQLKWSVPENGNYHWVNDPNIGAPNFYTGWEDPIVYTGELEWEDNDLEQLDIIPYQKIMKFEIDSWDFKPAQGGEKISYWVYTNDEWVDINDLPNPTDYIAIPVLSRGIITAPAIPLDKTRIYLNNVLLDKYLVDSVAIEEAYGCYVYVPRNVDFYEFKIEFDDDVVIGNAGTSSISIFANMNIGNNPDVQESIDDDVFEYYISGPAGKMVITNAGTK